MYALFTTPSMTSSKLNYIPKIQVGIAYAQKRKILNENKIVEHNTEMPYI